MTETDTDPRKPWWRRWYTISGAVLVVVVAVSAAFGGGGDDDDQPVAAAADLTTEATAAEATTTEAPEEPTTTARATTTVSPTTTTTADGPTTTVAPTTTVQPTTTTAPPPIVHEGSGTQVIELALPDQSLAVIGSITHQGGSNFAIWELDANLEQVDLAVNTIGNYAGNVLLNLDANTAALEITADGAWRVELNPAMSARRFDGEIAGAGDDVVIYGGDAQIMALTHDGESNFAIWRYGATDTDLLVNEIGPWTGTVPMPAGPGVLAITADGGWAIAPA